MIADNSQVDSMLTISHSEEDIGKGTLIVQRMKMRTVFDLPERFKDLHISPMELGGGLGGAYSLTNDPTLSTCVPLSKMTEQSGIIIDYRGG